MDIGYARVSTDDQKLDLQIDALTRYGCEKIFTDEGISGSKMQREGLKEALDYCRKGDRLVVWKLDRLGRNAKGLLELMDDLKSKGIDFVSITEAVGTSTPAECLMFGVLASVASFERELIQQRTQAGVIAAKQRGVKFGRKAKLTKEQYKSLMVGYESGKFTKQQLANLYEISRQSVYNYIRNGYPK